MVCFALADELCLPQEKSAVQQTYVVYYAAKILSISVPGMRSPGTAFLRRLEERLLELILAGRAQMVWRCCFLS
jgi:hypothetical protein